MNRLFDSNEWDQHRADSTAHAIARSQQRGLEQQRCHGRVELGRWSGIRHGWRQLHDDRTSVSEGTLMLNATCSDVTGHVGTASFTVKVDKTAPTLSPVVSPDPVPLNGTATVTSGAADAGSGVASQSCGALDTSSIGTKSVTCTATDNAGNTASASVSYSVVDSTTVTFNFSGYFAPVDNSGPGPTYVFNQTNAGKAVPVRFSLNGYQGMNILATGYPASQAVNCASASTVDTIEETVTAGNSSLTYDPTTDRYSYIWKTDKAWSGTCRKLTIKLTDGTDHVAHFKFVK
jgi:hypothetical protein